MFKFGIHYDYYPDEPKLIGVFSKVIGLEGEKIIDPSNELYGVSLIDGTVDPSFMELLRSDYCELPENCYICILDKNNQILVDYFFSCVEVNQWSLNDNGNVDIACEGFLHPGSHGSIKCWEMKIKGLIVEKGLWRNLHLSERQGWLEAAIRQTNKSDRKGLSVQIDGNLIDDQDSFYCALGEEVNGPGGYFGRSLGALDDCLSGDFGAKSPMKITWFNSNVSRKKMSDFDEFVSVLEDIFLDHNVEFELK